MVNKIKEQKTEKQKTKKYVFRKMYLSTFSLFFGFLVFGFFTISTVSAGIGVSPGSIENRNLKPGSIYKETFFLSQSDPKEDLKVVIEPDMKEANSWLTFEPSKEFIIPAGRQKFEFTVIVSAPNDADLKSYDGYIRIKTSSLDSAVAGGVSVVQGARLDVNLTTVNLDFTDLLIRGLSIDDVESGKPLELKMKIQNKGNVAAAPTLARLEILDLNQRSLEVLTAKNIDTVEPGETKEVFARFNSSLGTGEYFANAKVFFNDAVLREETLVFSIKGTPEDINTSDSFVLIGKIPRENLYATLGLILLIAICSIGSLIVYIRSTSKKETAKETTALAILFGIMFIILSITIFVIINYDSLNNNEGDVQGVSTTSTTGYNLYSSPDTDAAIVFTAREGTEFKILEEKEGWYKVQLPTNVEVQGWLRKEDVKEVVRST